MELLMEEMALPVPPAPQPRSWNASPVLTGLPYSAEGFKDTRCSLTLDLRAGKKLRVINQPKWDEERFLSIEVVESSGTFAREGHIQVRFGLATSSKSVVRVL